MRQIDAQIVVWGSIWVAILGADRAFAEDRSSVERNVVVATVGGEPIYTSDVDRLLAKATAGQEVNPAVLPVLQAQVLAEIVNRHLVLAYARRTKSGASSDEVDAAVSELKSKLRSQGRSLEDHLKEQSATEADLRRQVTWDLAWAKYLARYVTDQQLQSHFNTHRRQFDGTEVSVSHILLRPETESDPKAWDGLVEKARGIREEITSGKLSFAEAARKYSAGPSGAEGGNLGLISRRGVMVEAFSRAAFALEVGQVSRPVRTRFGVHLIRCNEIKPGNKQLGDVRDQLEAALGRELLEKLAQLEREYTPVKFTGTAPYFKPGTRELVVP